ncbi:MAG: cytochrome b/b6 domain-containing protein [bacterium]
MAHYEDIPYPVRIMHSIHLISIISLVFTGLCIRFHWFETSNQYIYLCKRHHYYFMIVVLINLVARMIYAFVAENKTYKDFAIGMQDIKNTPDVLKYYLFMQDDYPHVAKYASLQKLTYNLFWIITIIQGYIGFAILKPDLLLGIFASPEVAVIWARSIHTMIMWFFIITTTIHVYIAAIEGFPLLKLILFGIEPKESF